MLNKVLEIIIRSISTYILLLIAGRLIGRKLISRITFFDFIVSITLGSIAVRIALGSQESPYLAALTVVIITILVVITDYFDMKSVNFRKLVDGEPIILISSGKLLDYNLKKARITVNKLMMQLREKNIFDLEDVAIALIESDGELTVLPKPSKSPITTGDLNIQKNYNGISIDIIIDGKIMHDNLKSTNHDRQWLMDQLKTYNIYDVKDVFYAGLNSTGILYISKKQSEM
jgi:uncharacterized membrane protein YcaP (DUF421 family)